MIKIDIKHNTNVSLYDYICIYLSIFCLALKIYNIFVTTNYQKDFGLSKWTHLSFEI